MRVCVEVAEKLFHEIIPEEVDELGRNICHNLAFKGHLHILKFLHCRVPASVNFQCGAHDKRNMNALLIAAAGGQLEVVQWLLAPQGCGLR